MNKLILIVPLLLIISVAVLSETPIISTKQVIEDSYYRINCDQASYKWLSGTHYAYCNITFKDAVESINISYWLNKSTGVSTNKVYVMDKNGNYTDITGGTLVKGKMAPINKSDDKLDVGSSKLLQLKLEFITNGVSSDEFFLGLNNNLGRELILDPEVSGCIEYATEIKCANGTFVGDTISTTKNIVIYNATIDGTASAQVNLNSSAGWVLINGSTLYGHAQNLDSYVIIISNKNITVQSSTLNGYGTDGTTATTGNIRFNSSVGDINIINSTLMCTAGAQTASCSGLCNGGSSNFNAYALGGSNIININNTVITCTGAHGNAGGNQGGTLIGGSSFFNLYSNTIYLSAYSNTFDFSAGNANGGGYSQFGCLGGTSNILFNASKIFLNGYNSSGLTLEGDGGSYNNCPSGTLGQSKIKFIITDEIRFEPNISIVTQGVVTTNNSLINFSGNNNLKMIYSGISMSGSEYFYPICDNKPSNQNLTVLWEAFAGKTQNINFTYCSYQNTTRLNYFDAIPPSYSNFINNGTASPYASIVKFNMSLSDETSIASTIFAHNLTGTLTNQTPVVRSGTLLEIVYNMTVNLTKNNVICGQFWFNDTLGYSNQTNLSCFTVANTIPSIPNLIYPANQTSIGTNYTLLQYNSTDADNVSDSITFYIYGDTNTNPTTLVFNGSSYGNSTYNWSNLNDGTYYWKVKAGDGEANSSNSSVYKFIVSTLSPAINLKYPANTQYFNTRNISNFNFTVQDSDGIYECQLWHNLSGIFQKNQTNTSSITNDGTTSFAFAGANLTADEHSYVYNVWCNDTVGNGAFAVANYSFVVDTISPVLSGLSLSASSGTSTTIYANCTDYSTLYTNYPYVAVFRNVDGGLDANQSMTLVSGSRYSKTYAGFTSGNTYNFTFYCNDIVGNGIINNSNSLLFTYDAGGGTPPVTPGGGGGSITMAAVTNATEISGICGNSACEQGESPWTCSKDCPYTKMFELDQIFCTPIFDCGNWKTSWFNNIIVVMVLVSLVYFYYTSTKVGRLK